ncbi:Cardiolipin synthase, ClsA [hydrothermal vent metagenome]|uniref:Cardiolipin synthase, ClsA n=1 Tax=hydrothermal vent metagenome TaxID=652676 RepID=A0A3B1D927_9ZZZZ
MFIIAFEIPFTNIELIQLFGVLATFVYLLGIFSAIHAVMTVRTAQGTIAWAISLLTFPWVTLPLYWIFGRSKFEGYVNARRKGETKINHLVTDLAQSIPAFQSKLSGEASRFIPFERLARMPFTGGNYAKLLIDGQATFDAIFREIDGATDYILIEFFIVHNDQLGKELKERLIRKAKEKVRIYFLYDEVGSHKLPKSYIQELTTAGVDIRPFTTTRGGWKNRLQLNFRNHRKIVVVDGQAAFMGGLNVGDEYMGRDPNMGNWRDTHVKIIGPAVQCTQLAFIEDWFWASEELPKLNWEMEPSDISNMNGLILPTGPADRMETCGLFFVHAIHSAKKRLWITSPYFVPDSTVIAALQLAAVRGVDVRVMLPQKPDHLLVYLTSYVFLEKMDPVGVKIYRYHKGFMHQKVMLVDDDLAVVGTANLDNRSFRLNFEIAAIFSDRDFAAALAEMLEKDFSHSQQIDADELCQRPFWFRLAVRLSSLMSPIQ